MNAGTGHLVELSESVYEEIKKAQPKVGLFAVGETIELRNTRFRIVALGKQYMKLKVLPDSPVDKT